MICIHLCEADVEFIGNSEENYSKDWKDLATTVLEAGLSYNGEHGRKRKLGSQNNKIGLEVWKFPKIRLSVEVSTLICKDSLDLMITPWPYAVQQL